MILELLMAEDISQKLIEVESNLISHFRYQIHVVAHQKHSLQLLLQLNETYLHFE